MEQVKAEGLAKSIGLSNYMPKQIDAILETATVKPAINQIEFHPYLQQKDLLAYHREKVWLFLANAVWLTETGHCNCGVWAVDSCHQSCTWTM